MKQSKRPLSPGATRRPRPASRAVSTLTPLLLLLSLGLNACTKTAPSADATTGGNASATSTGAASSTGTSAAAGAPLNPAKFDAEISELERQAEKNPGDEDARNALSQAYLRRADAFRDAHQLREALRDYQNALRNNPDNEEAQQRIAAVSPQVEGESTGENGEPAPLPITPNVTTGDAGETDQPSPTPKAPAPKKKEK